MPMNKINIELINILFVSYHAVFCYSTNNQANNAHVKLQTYYLLLTTTQCVFYYFKKVEYKYSKKFHLFWKYPTRTFLIPGFMTA